MHKVNGEGKIVLAQTLTGPRGVIDYARNWHQKAEQPPRAPKTLGRARGKRASGAAAFATSTDGYWFGEELQAQGGAEPAGGATMGYDRGWIQQPLPAPQGHLWAVEQASAPAPALPARIGKAGPCATCGAAHLTKGCRGRPVPGVPAFAPGSLAPGAPCVRHSHPNRPCATHSNAQCLVPPGAPPGTRGPPPQSRFQPKRQRADQPRRRWPERSSAFLTTIASHSPAPPLAEVAAELAAGHTWPDQASYYLSAARVNQPAHPSAEVIAELTGNP